MDKISHLNNYLFPDFYHGIITTDQVSGLNDHVGSRLCYKCCFGKHLPNIWKLLPNIFAKSNKIEKLPSFSDLYLGNTTTGMFQLKTTMFRQNIFLALFTTKRSSF